MNYLGSFNFSGVNFNGGVGNAPGGNIAQYLQSNANITVNVTGGSQFAKVSGKAIITKNRSGSAEYTAGGMVAAVIKIISSMHR